MVKVLRNRFRVAAVLAVVLAVAPVFTNAALQEQKRRQMQVVENSCVFDARGPACLQNRIDKLQEQLAEVQEKIDHLQQVQKGMAAAVDSVGNRHMGKADGFDDIWTAIQTLRNEVKALER
jgi:chromosome segregation ATPase